MGLSSFTAENCKIINKTFIAISNLRKPKYFNIWQTNVFWSIIMVLIPNTYKRCAAVKWQFYFLRHLFISTTGLNLNLFFCFSSHVYHLLYKYHVRNESRSGKKTLQYGKSIYINKMVVLQLYSRQGSVSSCNDYMDPVAKGS